MKKKHLGQHFLHDPKLLRKIAESSPAQSGDVVLEIGPGDGALTQAILERGCRVVAVEYDTELIPVLENRFATEIDSGQLRLVQADFLEVDIAQILNCHPEEPMDTVAEFINHGVPASIRDNSGVYHVIANIPYYITGAILRKLLSGDCQPQSVSLIMQREVAERIVCRDNKQSLLSLSVGIYGEPHLVFRIVAGAFNPPPNVDSALLVVKGISRTRFQNLKQEELFFQLIHAGFAQRRKQLYKLIAHIVQREVFDIWCVANSLPTDVRAEDMPIDAWIDLVLCIDK